MIAPILDEVAAELTGKIKVVKISVDEAPQLATRYGIMSIPTLMLFKNGQVATQMVGAMAKAQLLDKINGAL
jgi:thioredoxin 1